LGILKNFLNHFSSFPLFSLTTEQGNGLGRADSGQLAAALAARGKAGLRPG